MLSRDYKPQRRSRNKITEVGVVGDVCHGLEISEATGPVTRSNEAERYCNREPAV